MTAYDATGQARPFLARRLTTGGMSVAVIEPTMLGELRPL
jgi:hypothetical protein